MTEEMHSLLAMSKSFSDLCFFRRMGQLWRRAEDKLHLAGLLYKTLHECPGMVPLKAVFRDAGETGDGREVCTEIKVFGVQGELPFKTFIHPVWKTQYRRYSYEIKIEFENYEQDAADSCMYKTSAIVSEKRIKEMTAAT